MADRRLVLHTFRTDPEVGVLLMDSSGSVGLDLSFASYVFLMEPLADRSLEQQVRDAHIWNYFSPTNLLILQHECRQGTGAVGLVTVMQHPRAAASSV